MAADAWNPVSHMNCSRFCSAALYFVCCLCPRETDFVSCCGFYLLRCENPPQNLVVKKRFTVSLHWWIAMLGGSWAGLSRTPPHAGGPRLVQPERGARSHPTGLLHGSPASRSKTEGATGPDPLTSTELTPRHFLPHYMEENSFQTRPARI